MSTGGVEYTVTPQGFIGPYVLQASGVELGRAVKAGVFSRKFVVSAEGQRYLLKRMSWRRHEYGLFSADQRVGSIVQESWMRRRAMVDLPENMPVPVQAFIARLAMWMWKGDGG